MGSLLRRDRSIRGCLDGGVSQVSGLVPAPSTAGRAGAAGRDCAQRAAVSRHRKRLYPRSGHGPRDGLHSGRSVHLVPGDGAPHQAFSRDRAGRSGGRIRDRFHRWWSAQFGQYVHVAETHGGAQGVVGRGDQPAARKAQERARRAPVHGQADGHPHRRAAEHGRVRLHAAGRRNSGSADLGAAHPAGAGLVAGTGRREQRRAGFRHADLAGHRSRCGLAPGVDHGADRFHAQRCVRSTAGGCDLQPAESVPRGDGSRATLSAEPGNPARILLRQQDRATGAAVGFREDHHDQYTVVREPPGRHAGEHGEL